MSVKYITTGDEFAAKGLLGEGRHQLSILKNAMSFQNLQQLQRIVRFDDGTVIKCLSCFGQDVVNVFVPFIEAKEEERKIVEAFFCWCNCCFTEGVITEVIDDYDDVGNYTKDNGDPVYADASRDFYYPKCCVDSAHGKLRRYEGIRYKVSVCVGDKRKEFICAPSDFIKYKKRDKVVLLIVLDYKKSAAGYYKSVCLNECPPNEDGKLKGEGACEGIRRPGRKNDENAGAAYEVTLTDSIDGTYMIMPFTFPLLPGRMEELRK